MNSVDESVQAVSKESTDAKEAKENDINKKFSPSNFQIICLGFAIVSQDMYTAWNLGLLHGFWTCLVSLIWAATAYLIMILCLAEMTSTLPFSGGAYGFVRMALSPFIGFIVGCCEITQGILYLHYSMVAGGQLITAILGTSKVYEPLFWLVFYITALPTLFFGKRFFWLFASCIGILSVIGLLIYIFGSISSANFPKYSMSYDSQFYNKENVKDSELPSHFFTALANTYWVVIGWELLALAGLDCENPRVQVPRSMVLGLISEIIIILPVVFLCSSNFPGVPLLSDPSTISPLSFGFSRIFNISTLQAEWTSIYSFYCLSYGYLFGLFRQLMALKSSGLLPTWLTDSWSKTAHLAQYIAVIRACLLSYILSLIVWFIDSESVLFIVVIGMLANIIVAIAILLSFIQFRKKYGQLKRKFTNPLGLWSAYIAIFMLLVCLIAALGYSGFTYMPVVGFFFCLTIYILFYFLYAKQRQKYSLHEEKVLFGAYVINANQKIRASMKRGSRTPKGSRKSKCDSKSSLSSSKSVTDLPKLHSSSSDGEVSKIDSSSELDSPPKVLFQAIEEEESVGYKFPVVESESELDQCIDGSSRVVKPVTITTRLSFILSDSRKLLPFVDTSFMDDTPPGITQDGSTVFDIEDIMDTKSCEHPMD